MLPDALPQQIDTLLRLPLLEAAQLRELIQHLPDPQAAAQEMVRRGWITQDQFSSLVPGPEQGPAPRETMLGFGDDENPPDPDCDWSLPIDEEDTANVPPEVEWALLDGTEEELLPEAETVEAVPVLWGAASTPQFELDVPVALVAGGNEARRRQSDSDKHPRRWIGWASKGLLMCPLLFGSIFAALQFFGANSAVPPVARQESSQANAGDPARTVDLPPVAQFAPFNNAKQRDDPLNRTGQKAQPAAPVAGPLAASQPVPQGPSMQPQVDTFQYGTRQVIKVRQ